MQGTRLGSYELIRRLGEGGMAQVYLARDIRLGREVAVKVLDSRLAQRSGFRERFLREARVAAALDHPNIVPLYDFGDSSGVLYLVMPYLSGGSLQDALKRAPFPISDVVSYGAQITDALDYAHQRGVIHRDVKPANMLLHADGRLLLADFGLAKILDGSSRLANRHGKPDAGTPEYMAPEQIQGRTDARSDLYGLGVVLYLLLTGRLPFTGASSNAVMEGHLHRLPESPRRLNPAVTHAVEGVVLRALAKHPEDRYQRASEMGAALLEALVAGEAEPVDFGLSPSSPLFSRPSSLPDISAAPQLPGPFTPGFAGSQGSQGARSAGQNGSTSFLPSLDVPEAGPRRSLPNSAGSGVSRPLSTGAPYGPYAPTRTPDRLASVPQREYPQREYPQREYPQREYPQREYPQREHLPTQPLAGVNLPSEIAVADPLSQVSQGMLAPSLAPSASPSMSPSVAQARAPRPALDSESLDDQRHGRGRWLWIAIAMLLTMMALALGALIWFFPG